MIWREKGSFRRFRIRVYRRCVWYCSGVVPSLRTRIYIFFLTSLRLWRPRLSKKKQGVQLALRNRCFRTRSNALLPRGFLDTSINKAAVLGVNLYPQTIICNFEIALIPLC
ncbi:hypothetical protein T12_7161 [Trichinella patagoniensis]|uniref:Uncharacterized protein n=1 Tax=Trichinella patagoniensis TaxID=990121 RepID=A0A0V0ZSA0_9BILA|nr:hypothetical protein T12_7161 [Trichinella patagoniensis]